MTAAQPTGKPAADFAKGLAGVIAGQTSICSLDGTLRYRGYDIEPLATAGDFEEVAFLLLHGELPSHTELAAFRDRVAAAARSVDTAVLDALARLAASSPQASVMDALRTAISMLGLVEHDDTPGPQPALIAQAERLLGQTPAILAAWIDLTSGRTPRPWPDGPVAQALLERITGREASPRQVAIFGATLVLYAEHEFNASTFAARTVASTGSDLHSAVTAAIGALKGPLHGGANEKVLEVLGEIGSADRADAWVHEQFAAKRVVMGFGHRVYKDGDVRAKLLGSMCREMVRGTEGDALEDLADRVERIMLEKKALKPNLDWPAARVYHALGLPVKVFTPIFVVARMSGWTAHVIEQIGDNRIIRPLSIYSGTAAREYVPVDARG
ncbi:MAG: citrate/2-methylcitrate synthase [Planctomycetota bacterium]